MSDLTNLIDDKARLEYERDRQRSHRKSDLQKSKAKAVRRTSDKPAAPTSRVTHRQAVKRAPGKENMDDDLVVVEEILLDDSDVQELHYAVIEEREFDFADFIVERPSPRRDGKYSSSQAPRRCRGSSSSSSSSATSIPATPSCDDMDPSLGFLGASAWFITEARDGCAHFTTPPPTWSHITLHKREW